MMSIKNLAKAERPREKLINRGAANLKDSELLAVLLGTGTEGKDAQEYVIITKNQAFSFKQKRLI